MTRKALPVAIAALAILLSGTHALRATEGESPAEDAASEEKATPPDLFSRDTLLGDLGGLRSRIEGTGIQLGATYISELLGNPSGGQRQGTIYEARAELFTNIDLEKLLGWSGALFHANAYQVQGRGLSANDVGNILIASNIEATRATRLFDVWLQQELLDKTLSIRAGQIAADDEFVVSQYASTFINSTFGWPGILGANLPSGGPAYPLATPGLRVSGAPATDLSFSAAIFSGNPSGGGTGNPQLDNPSGTTFSTAGGAFLIGEAGYTNASAQSEGAMPRSLKLGGWFHDGRFADRHLDAQGRSLAAPGSTGTPAMRQGDFGLYLVFDQALWRDPDMPDQGLSMFLRAGGNPGDRNLVEFSTDGGLTYKGMIAGRDSDTAGLAVSFIRIGDAARALDRDVRRFTGLAVPVRDYEIALELTYQAQIAPWWLVQPDLQYVVHPGGNVPLRSGPATRAASNAFVIGTRTAVTF